MECVTIARMNRIILNYWIFYSELIDFDFEIWLLWNSYLKGVNFESKVKIASIEF